jgi:hypothetical protein
MAFLNQTGCDPLDLVLRGFFVPEAPKEFNAIRFSQNTLSQQWERLLAQTGEEFQKALHPALRAAAPQLPLYFRGMNGIAPWTKPVSSLRAFDTMGLRWLDPFPYLAPGRTRDDFWRVFQNSRIPGAGSAAHYEGYVAYFADLPWSEAKSFLTVLTKTSEAEEVP